MTQSPANYGRIKTGQWTVFGTKFFYPACSPSGKHVFVRKPLKGRCGRDKAKAVIKAVRSSLISWCPESVFTGHSASREGTQFLQSLVEGSEESLGK
jgi:hypothetical protein